MPIRRAETLLLLVATSCAAMGANSVHPSFEQTYRSARVVAVLPPVVSVWSLTGGGLREYQEAWSRNAQERLIAQLRSALEKRGLAMAMIEATPGNAVPLEEVRRRCDTIVPAFRAAQEKRRVDWLSDQRFPQYTLGEIGLLLDPAGAELLLIAEATQEVKVSEGLAVDLADAFLEGASGGFFARTTAASPTVSFAIIDRSGALIFLGEGYSVEVALSALPDRP